MHASEGTALIRYYSFINNWEIYNFEEEEKSKKKHHNITENKFFNCFFLCI